MYAVPLLRHRFAKWRRKPQYFLCVPGTQAVQTFWKCCQTGVQAVPFFTTFFFLWIIEAGLAAEAETAAAHQLPYANAPCHSSFIKYNQGIWGLLGYSLSVIHSKHWHAFSIICSLLLSISLISEKKRTNWNTVPWSLVVSDYFHSANNIT